LKTSPPLLERLPTWLLLGISPVAAASNLSFSAWLVDIPPLTLCALRWSMTSLLLIPLLRAQSFPWDDCRHQWRLLIGLAALGLVGMSVTVALGSRLSSPSLLSLANSTLPFLIVLCGCALYGDRLTKPVAGGLLLALVGVAMPAAMQAWQGAGTGAAAKPSLVGLAILMTGMISYAIFSTRLRLLQGRPSGLSLMAVLSPVAAVICLGPAVWELVVLGGFHLTGRSVAAVIYLAAVPSALAIAAWSEGIRRVGSTRAAVYFALLPVSAAFFNWLLMNVVPSPWECAGFILIALGLGLSARPAAAFRRGANSL